MRRAPWRDDAQSEKSADSAPADSLDEDEQEDTEGVRVMRGMIAALRMQADMDIHMKVQPKQLLELQISSECHGRKPWRLACLQCGRHGRHHDRSREGREERKGNSLTHTRRSSVFERYFATFGCALR